MAVNISFDLETWGKKPGCDIRSIGACVFNPLTDYVPHAQEIDFIRRDCFYVATENKYWDDGGYCAPGSWMSYDLTRDPETEAWWAKQSDEAQAAFKDPILLRDALLQFTDFIHNASEDVRDGEAHDVCLWSHGPAFDPPILVAAYDAVGLPVPWFYRAPRDTRTAFDMVGIEDHSAHLKRFPGPLGIKHHALDDAISQAQAISAVVATARYHIPHL